MRVPFSSVAIAAVSALLLSGGLATSASADTIPYTLSNGAGTVTVMDIGGAGSNEVQITIAYASGVTSAQTGALGQQVLAFDLASTATLSLSNATGLPSGVTLSTQSGGGGDGVGTFTNSVVCSNCGNGSSNPQLSGTITFDLTATSGTLSSASFVPNTATAGGNFPLGTTFAADVCIASLGKNCTLDVGVPGPILGAGIPGLITACGAMLALARRRRRQVV